MLSLIPVRAEASDRAEQVTQVLFGECFTIVEEKGNWLLIELASDKYRGWIDFKQSTPVTEAYFRSWCSTPHARALGLVQYVASAEGKIPIGIGSYLPFLQNGQMQLNDLHLAFEGEAAAGGGRATGAQLLQVAKIFLKAPYQWGGKSVFGIDCSGFVQQVYGICGIQLPRDACQQVTVGEEVHFATETKAGDLAFFSNDEGRIVHVGLMLERQQIIHAHGEVRIDTLDHNGIFNSSRKKYSHKLRIIKRLVRS